jgi:DNA-binding NarL/FixJ family response regulator
VKVLIADDSRLLLEGFRRALERVEDIEIVGATHSGAHLLELVERRRPQLVAMEVDLRDAGGAFCLDALRRHHPDIKVVVLSSSTSPELIRSALHRGAAAFIVKSVNPLDIPSVLRQAYEQTVYHAIGITEAPEDGLRSAGLTEREITILSALARGLSNKAISRELWLAEPTVKFHLRNLYRKLGVQNRLAAAGYAHRHGLGGGAPGMGHQVTAA